MATQEDEAVLLQECGLCGRRLALGQFSAAHCDRCDRLLMDIERPGCNGT
ncbi:MAG: hypothetical protein AMXMBFR13_50090 [Phycisphaerae bacterium]